MADDLAAVGDPVISYSQFCMLMKEDFPGVTIPKVSTQQLDSCVKKYCQTRLLTLFQQIDGPFLYLYTLSMMLLINFKSPIVKWLNAISLALSQWIGPFSILLCAMPDDFTV